MRILLLNPPHLSIGSRLPKEHLPPLGLLCIGGPLLDAGHVVELFDADYHNSGMSRIVAEVLSRRPDVVMTGHAGSTSAQPIINEITKLIKAANPNIKIILGGVFPTYHWHEVLASNPQIDYIICGEGEQTALNLINALANNLDPKTLKGLAFNIKGTPFQTTPADLIENLDEFRIGWELMRGYHYTYWGKHKAVVIQFSRGCPFPCTYCGQSLFWRKWRHRDPQKLADEFEMLHKEYGVEVFNFGDENPTYDKKAWQAFLEALIAKNMDIKLVGSIRADSIVRDADILHLYKKAGFEHFLLGIESYDAQVLESIKKGSTKSKDMEAIQLLRRHDILSMTSYVVGFGEEMTRDFYYSLKQLRAYDPDQIEFMYATPHKWTPFFTEAQNQELVLTDQRKWDYRHQVLAVKRLKPWQVLLCVKLIEVIMQSRPKALKRLFFHRDKKIRQAMFWYTNIGKRVWFWEIFDFFFITGVTKSKMQLKDFWK